MEVYSKEITDTDAHVRLSVSTRRLDDHFFELAAGERSREFEVADADDGRQSWTFLLKIRSQGYRKPEISGDWLGFVRCKNVQVGDRVEFFKEYYYDQATGTEMMRYRTRVWEPILVFGALIGEKLR